MDELLSIVESVRPPGTVKWQRIANILHSRGRLAKLPVRDAECYKKKFYSLTPRQKPTGHAKVPHCTKQAIRIQKTTGLLELLIIKTRIRKRFKRSRMSLDKEWETGENLGS